MAKDINIKVKTEGIDQAKSDFGDLNQELSLFNLNVDKEAKAAAQAAQDQRDFAEYLKDTANAATEAGDSVEQAGEKSADAMEKPAEKANGLIGFLRRTESQALRMVAGFLGLQGVMRLISALNEQLDQMIEKQKKLTETAMTSAEGGQALEAATGTVGKQDYWTRQILSLQKAGGLASQEQASALMLGLQGATQGVGGIRNPAVAAMLQRLAPMLGASGKSAGELNAIFETAAKEGVGPEGLEPFISGRLGVSGAQAHAYLQSPLGRSRIALAGQAYRSQVASMDYRDWQTRLAEAQEELDRRTAMGENRILVRDRNEVMQIALESLTRDLVRQRDQASGPERQRLEQTIREVGSYSSGADDLLYQFDPFAQQIAYRTGMNASRVTIDNRHITQNLPIVGPDQYRRGARVDPNDL